MSKLEVDAIEPQSGTTLTIGASGDTVNIASGATITDFTSTGIDDNATANALTIDSSSNLQFNSGYGSVATAYGCRAWVNFNGTGTPAIRGSGNVTSITDVTTGTFTINFTNAMPDINYAAAGMGRSNNFVVASAAWSSTSSATIKVVRHDNVVEDEVHINVIFLR